MNPKDIPYEELQAWLARYKAQKLAEGMTEEQFGWHIESEFEKAGFTRYDAMRKLGQHALRNEDPAIRAEAAELMARVVERNLLDGK